MVGAGRLPRRSLMKTILLVDDDRSLALLREGVARLPGPWRAHEVHHGQQALEWLAREHAHVVITALILPDMDGAQLLQRVFQLQPGAIRLALAGDSERELALQKASFAHQHLAKPCQAEQLGAALHRAFVLRDILTSQPLQKLVSQIHALPSLPDLYLQLMGELRSEDPALDRVGEIVSRDLAMSARLLQLVNSAFFGLGDRVASPTQAAIYLGLETVKSLVLSLQIFSHFSQSRLPPAEFSQERLWSHSWTTGLRARRIAGAETCDPTTADHCFVGGLLHDVGKLILACELPERYQAALQRAQQQRIHMTQAEKEALGCTHAELGAFLLHQWHLPDPVVQAVALHHRPADILQPVFSPLTAVHAANALEHRLQATMCGATAPRLDLDYLRACGVSARLEDWRGLCLQNGMKKRAP
jgi:HD-like signal output (HDOD) protein